MKILHTMLRVGDLDRAIRFYTEVLGMRLLRRDDHPDGQYTLAFLGFAGDENGAQLELTYNWGVDHYEPGNGYGHVAIAVPDVAQAVESARSMGATITLEPRLHGGRTWIAFVQDPDGYAIEFVQRAVNPG